jgi:hypothetical protein
LEQRYSTGEVELYYGDERHINRRIYGSEPAEGDEHFRYNKKMSDLINNYHNVFKEQDYELLDMEKY